MQPCRIGKNATAIVSQLDATLRPSPFGIEKVFVPLFAQMYIHGNGNIHRRATDGIEKELWD